jgi:hypothetical protein
VEGKTFLDKEDVKKEARGIYREFQHPCSISLWTSGFTG